MKIKKISAALLCSATVLFAGSSFAQNQELALSTLKGYDLPPHQAVKFNGSWFSSQNFKCTVRAEKNDQNPLLIEALKNRAVINGVILPEGSLMTVLAKVGDKIEFELDARAKLTITNDADTLMNIRCN
ncbi:hypothetical protein [Legionella gresilensis]|uniref:hypothetical protein n=1 Tax=Legionella gresilensis TaxID=91823 RepID=UPI0010415713|nr:hypothetical protein [Legionella gresilensis]